MTTTTPTSLDNNRVMIKIYTSYRSLTTNSLEHVWNSKIQRSKSEVDALEEVIVRVTIQFQGENVKNATITMLLHFSSY